MDQNQLFAALQDVELQNDRLRSTLTVMRGEMEALQVAAAAAAMTVVPQDVAVLQAELQVGPLLVNCFARTALHYSSLILCLSD